MFNKILIDITDTHTLSIFFLHIGLTKLFHKHLYEKKVKKK